MWPTLHLPNGTPPPPGAVDPRALHPSVSRLIANRPDSDLWTPGQVAPILAVSDKMVIYACNKGLLEYSQPEGRGQSGKLIYLITTRSLIGYILAITRGLSEGDISLLIACSIDSLSPKALLALSNHIQGRLKKQHPYDLPAVSDLPEHLQRRATAPSPETLTHMTLLQRLKLLTSTEDDSTGKGSKHRKLGNTRKDSQLHLFS